MSDAIAATFSGFKPVLSRKAVQLVFEIPVEKFQEALATLGTPGIETDVWCGIALMPELRSKKLAEGQVEAISANNQLERNPSAKPTRKWADVPAKEQAGIRCGEATFHIFMKATAATVAQKLRAALGVESRADLDTNPDAVKRWHILDGEYRYWLGQQR